MLKKIDYFTLFGLKPSFKISMELLKNKYHKLCKECHPDLNNNIVNFKFTDVNKAYNVLKDDYQRAKYMQGNVDKKVSNNFLSDILELEERINKADIKTLEEIKKDVEKSIMNCKNNYDKNEYLSRWRYYIRMLNLINNKLDLYLINAMLNVNN